MVTIAAVILAIGLGAAPSRRVERCHVAFQLPAGWVASPGTTKDGNCRFDLSPRSRRRSQGSAITIDVFAGSIDDAEGVGQFSKDEHGWFTEGRQGVTNRAEEIKTPCCVAIRGFNEVGRYGKAGYLGMGQMRVAFVAGKGRAAFLQSSLDGDADQVFDRLLLSLEFR